MSGSTAPPLPSRWKAPAQSYTGELKTILEALQDREPDGVARLTLRAAQGDAAAAEVLGNAFLDGYRVTPSWARAKKWLRQAAKRGHPAAQRQYATLRWEEEANKAEPDEAVCEELLSYLAKAAEAGDARALIGFGSYKTRLDDAEERAAGVEMLERAAAQGHGTAMKRLSNCYEEGLGVEVDPETAYTWVILAHAHGDPRGAYSETWLRIQLTDDQLASAERRAEAWRPAVT
jgi:hypothetical protein